MKRNAPRWVTPEHCYVDRRRLLRGLGVAVVGLAFGECRGQPKSDAKATGTPTPDATPPAAGSMSDEFGNPLTSYERITGYTNYYEFSLGKEGNGDLARSLHTDPWVVQVGGLVDRPLALNIREILTWPQEERVYRWRCVEAWSMVVPWVGIPLRRLLEAALPQTGARFVRFESLADPDQMPGLRDRSFPWPYVEGLRLDEAMHPLTLLATGLYGQRLTPQNGAPVRLVVPWKYGFKSLKAIVRIDLVAEQPLGFWQRLAPHEYGFYASVNPDVPHPRWSQATERVIGQVGRRKTAIFNGYGEEVAAMYAGMDLAKDY